MKKITSTFFLLLILSISAFSDPVDSNTARLVAKNFMVQQSPGNQTVQAAQLDLAYVCTTTDKAIATQSESLPLFYVYNVKGGQGFIIVSADNDALPILGYTTEGNYSGYDMPVAFEKLLEKYKQEIKSIKLKSLKADERITTLWQENLNGSYVSYLSTNTVSPLTATKWNQAPYYNALCPYDATYKERTVTGCAATAMAQIMKFWNFPTQGSGFYSYNHSTYGTLSANFGSTTYNWAGMPNSVTSANTAVATLMFHVGVSIEMNYGPGSTGGSGAYVISSASATQACCEYALKTNFGYASSLQGILRDSYSDATWIQKLKTDLDAGRPILYTGFGQGGHAFVCDGYDASNNFHFNWGWGGMYDGYFNINSLNPGTGGAGSGAGTYNNGQQALLGIKPITGTTSSSIELNSAITVNPNPIDFGIEYTVNADVINKGTTSFSGSYCAALFDPSQNLVDFVQVLSTGSSPLPPNYHYTSGLNFVDTIRTVPGNYTIGIFYKPDGGDWVLAGGTTYQNPISITINGPVNNINLYSAMVASPTAFIQGQSATVSAKLLNSGSTTYYGEYQAALIDLTGKYIVETIDLYSETGGLPAGYAYSTPITFSTSAITSAPGTYILTILEKETGFSNWWYVAADYFTNPIYINVVEPTAKPDIYEVNNTEVTAYNLPVTFSGNSAHIVTTGSNIHLGNDVDYYKVLLPSGSNYSISARVHDSYNSGNSITYTNDVVFAYNDGTGWSDSYDDIMSSNIIINNGGTLAFNVVPRYSGNTGTYLLDLTITKSNAGSITITAPVAGNAWKMGSSQNITWTDNISEDVLIELYKGLTNLQVINVSAPSNGAYSWLLPTSLAADINYRIKVTSTVNSNIFDYSSYFTINNAVSINEKTESAELVNFYPNPVSKFLNIELLRNDLSFDHVKIVNALGETVLDENQAIFKSINSLNLSDLDQGVYFLTLTGNQQSVSYRFSVVK